MKIRITDLITDCCPEAAILGEYDGRLAERIDRRVQQRISTADTRPTRTRRLPKAVLLAAVLVLSIGTVAFAVVGYSMSHRKPAAEEDLVSGFRYETIVDGKVWNSEILSFPDAGMVFTFNCPEPAADTAEFRCFWLPGAATEGITDEEGWTKYLFRDEGDTILYSISTLDYIRDGMQLVLSGDVEVVGEENWDDWQILKVSADCSDLIYPTYDRANYILLYQNSTGYLIVVAGEAEMETLEHIAREMEIRRSDIPKHEDINGLPVGSMDLARG